MLGACRLAGLSALEAYYAGSAWARNAGRTRARVRRIGPPICPRRSGGLPWGLVSGQPFASLKITSL